MGGTSDLPSARERGTHVDRRTGEVFDLVSLRPRRQRRTDTTFAIVYQAALARLTEQDDLTLSEWRVLMRLVAIAPLGDCVPGISQVKLAHDLNIHRHTVARSIASLVERGYVVRDPDDPSCLWVSPELGRVGDRRR